MQTLEPLAIVDVGLGPAIFGQGARINEDDLEAVGLEQLAQRDPGDACGFQGHSGDATEGQPRGQGVATGRVGREGADGLGVGFHGDGDPVRLRTDINTCSVHIDGVQLRGKLLFCEGFCTLVFGHGSLHNESKEG